MFKKTLLFLQESKFEKFQIPITTHRGLHSSVRILNWLLLKKVLMGEPKSY